MKNLAQNIELFATVSKIKGTTYCGIRNYKSKTSGDIANYLLTIGYSNENAKKHDYQKLVEKQNEIFETLEKEFSVEVITLAYNEMLNSLEIRLSDDETKEKARKEGNTTLKRSDAQIDAYIEICNGIKINKETNQVHIFGLENRKTIVEKNPIEKKPTKSNEKTIVKRKIEKICSFRQGKIRNFILDNTQINLKNLSIKF